jgi:large subunit ribosomal protein L16
MFLQPKRIKYKKVKKGRLSKLDFRANTLKFGEVGLKSQMPGLISSRQIESARRAIKRKIKKKGKIWLRIFPDLPITSKPTESRMGKGKGSVSHWVSRVKGGTVLFEICGVPKHIAKEALRSGSFKIPVKTRIFD